MATTPDESPLTETGTPLSGPSPLPSCPDEFPPQHFTAPEVVRAQVCCTPAVIARTPEASPVTCTDVKTPPEATCPSPNWPQRSSPQHRTAPAEVTAQV